MATGYKKHLTEDHEIDHVLNLMHYSKSKLQGKIQVTSKHVLIGRKLSNHIYYLKLLTGLYLRSTEHFCQYDHILGIIWISNIYKNVRLKKIKSSVYT